MSLSAEDLARKFARSRQPNRQHPEAPQNIVKLRQNVRNAPVGDTLPPHSNDAEEAILGACIANPKQCIPEMLKWIPAKFFFFDPVHATIYQALHDIWDSGQGIDLITFTQFLRDRSLLDSVGGAGNITSLFAMNPIATAENVEWYAQTVRQKFLMREMISAGTNMTRATYGAQDDEIPDILQRFSSRLEKIKCELGGPNGTEIFTVENMKAFDASHDPNSLVGHRWIVRGGSYLWAGGSGYGKSSLEMQLAIYWACGQPCFGLKPVSKLKSLIVQAENDLGDMSEQFQGIYNGIQNAGDLDLDECSRCIEQNIVIRRVIGKTGFTFLGLLDSLIEIDRPDIVWVDPLLAFAGCDLMNAEKTGRFLREGLFPIAVKRNVAMNALHHVAKPIRDKTKENVISDIDYQYLGFGTSEIQNAFRGVNIIIPSSDFTYRLIFSKRGLRSGAKTTEGDFTQSVYLKHSTGGAIFWMQVDDPNKPQKTKFDAQDLLDQMSVVNGIAHKDLKKRMEDVFGWKKATFDRRLEYLRENHKIKPDSEGKWVLNKPHLDLTQYH